MTTDNNSRPDGRAPGDIRPIRVQVGYQQAGEGSVFIEQGNTRVLCTASVEYGQPPHLKGTDQGWVTAEYSMLPRANPQRRAMREAVTGRRKGRTFEIERMIGRALRSVVDLKAVGTRTVYIDCDVLQADGGTRVASIIGGFLAMAQAFQRGMQKNDFKRMPIRALLAAVSVGVVDGRVIADLSYHEDSRASVDMNVVWTSEGRLAEVDASGESHTFTETELSEMLAMSKQAAERVFEIQRAALPMALVP